MSTHATRWMGVRLLAVVALAAVSLTSGVGAATAHPSSTLTRVAVDVSDGQVTVQKRVQGRVLAFDVSTKSEFGVLQVFAPRPGRSVASVLAPLRVQLGLDPASADPEALAQSTRDLTRNAQWFGGVDVSAGQVATFSVRLDGGTYYLIDLAPAFGPAPRLGPVATLTVSGDGSGGRPRADARIEMRGTDAAAAAGVGHGHAFRAPASMPAAGVVEVKNQDEVIHFLSMSPVKPGTTRQDIEDFLRRPPTSPQDPGPFLQGPGASLNVLSPGGSAQLTYDLPKGLYVMACFIADEEPGAGAVPHVQLGMFELIELT